MTDTYKPPEWWGSFCASMMRVVDEMPDAPPRPAAMPDLAAQILDLTAEITRLRALLDSHEVAPQAPNT